MRPCRVLLVEDEAAVRGLLASALHEAGYCIVEAPNGREALALQRQMPCDVIVTDIFMPDKDGLEVVQQLRSVSTHVKIVAISGGGQLARLALDFDPLTVARKLGADAVLQKPFSVDALLSTVRSLTVLQ